MLHINMDEGCVHDYGIVYGKTNYLIGVFTEDVQNAKKLIANISKGILDVNEKNIQPEYPFEMQQKF